MSQPYQVLPPLNKDDFAALRQSILDHGVRVPVEVDDEGNIIDGHNRAAICEAEGIKHYPKRINTGLTDWEKRTLARELNAARRHLSTAQKRELVEAQLRDTPTLSDRAIATRLGVSDKTVGSRRKVLVDRAEIPHVEEREDTLGRSQPSQRQRTIFVDESADGRANTVARAAEIVAENKAASKGLRASIGTERNPQEADDLNLYESPWVAAHVLNRLVPDMSRVWEPACGPGSLLHEFDRLGLPVLGSDVENYGVNDDGEINPVWEKHNCAVQDFLSMDVDDLWALAPNPLTAPQTIATNPPFNRADAFIAKALELARAYNEKAIKSASGRPTIKTVAMLLRLNFAAGCGPDRCASLDAAPFHAMRVFSRRLPMMHRHGHEGPEMSSRLDTAWFIWRLDHAPQATIVTRHDWEAELGLTKEQAKLCRDGADYETVMAAVSKTGAS